MLPLPAKGEICAVMLFGSRARGDHTPESDIDILLCLREGTPSLSGEGNLSISIYPKAQLLEMAGRGDLFVFHLVSESMVLWEADGFSKELRTAFAKPSDPAKVIANATDLGSLLLDRALHFPPDLLNRRVAWVVRSILTARSIADGNVTFAASKLSDRYADDSALTLMQAKNSDSFDAARLKAFRLFLEKYGDATSLVPCQRSWQTRFTRNSNTFGLKTLQQLDKLAPYTMYC